MKNKNKTVWSNRFKSKTSQSFQKIGSSIHIDKRLYEQDIAASIVHTQMLSKQKIIKSEDANKIINGLKKIKAQIDKGNFEFKEKFEDIHLNIEKALFDIIGPSAGYMHTARSRNDQVVTDFKLWIKDASKEILKDISLVMKNLLKKAEKNTDTVMPGLTHLKNAQPISFAHYILSYFEMLKRDKKRFENNLDLLDECPLGSAAQPHIKRLFLEEKENGITNFRKVVNISSTSGMFGNAGQINYATAKAGVVGMAKTMAKEWGRYNVNVNAVGFGLIKTRLTDADAEKEESLIDIEGNKIKVGVNSAVFQSAKTMIPLGRPGTPQEAAGAIYMFCIPESNYVTGQILMCHGGGFGY